MIQAAQLRKLLPDLSNDALISWISAFNNPLAKNEIVTPKRLAYFFAQILHESAGLTRLEENLNYSSEGLLKTFPKYFKDKETALAYARQFDKIANRVYANRMGNGPEMSGDGWRYRGRGPIQITGKDNYYAIGAKVFGDGRKFIDHPELLKQPQYGAEAACWFWNAHKLNLLADSDNFEGITRAINGGLNGYADRLKWLIKCKTVFV